MTASTTHIYRYFVHIFVKGFKAVSKMEGIRKKIGYIPVDISKTLLPLPVQSPIVAWEGQKTDGNEQSNSMSLKARF